MTYEEFEKLLDEVKLTKKDFAEMVDMNYKSITNWNILNIPSWVKSWLENYKKAKDMNNLINIMTPYIKK